MEVILNLIILALSKFLRTRNQKETCSEVRVAHISCEALALSSDASGAGYYVNQHIKLRQRDKDH